MAINMAPQQEPAMLVERELQFTLSGLCQARQVESLSLVELVREGEALRRARLALRLQRELELGPHGTALVMDLLDQIRQLKARLAALPNAQTRQT